VHATDSTALKTTAAIDTCDGGSAQNWTVNSDGTIVNGSGLCLSLSGAWTTAKSTADVYTCNGSACESGPSTRADPDWLTTR
jgi:chitinase